MIISLQHVTVDNYEAVCNLSVSTVQRNYVANNMFSLVEASFNPGYQTRAIYLRNEPVGFMMWLMQQAGKMEIWRFMVDHKFQYQSIGRIAFGLALAEIRQQPGLCCIEICYNPENPLAKAFYASFGFVETGMDAENEDTLALPMLFHTYWEYAGQPGWCFYWCDP